MTNVTFTTTKVASDFQNQEQQSDFVVGHFAPAFSNTGITVDFQASNIEWTGAIRASNVVTSEDIVTTTPQVTVLGSNTSFGVTQVSLSGLTVTDATAIRAFSLITIAGNTDPQGNIFDVAYANFRLSGQTYPPGGDVTTAYANFAIAGTTSNAGVGAVTGQFYIDISNSYYGQGYSIMNEPITSVYYDNISNIWLAGNSSGQFYVSNNFSDVNSTTRIWTGTPIWFITPFKGTFFVGGGRSGQRRLYRAETLSTFTSIDAVTNVGTPVEAYSNGNVLMVGVDEGINGVMYTTNGSTWSILPGNANANIYLTGTHAIDYNSNTWSLFFGDLESGVGDNSYYQISNLSSNTLSRVNFNTGRTYYITDAARNGNVLALAGRTTRLTPGSGVVLHNTGNTWQQANLPFVPWGINYISGNYYAYGGQYPLIGDITGAGPGIVARSSDLVSWSNVVSATNQFVDMATDGNKIIAVGYTSGISDYWSSNVNSNVWTDEIINLDRKQTVTIPAYDVFAQSNVSFNYGNADVINANVVTNTIISTLQQGNTQEYSVSYTSPIVDYENLTVVGNGLYNYVEYVSINNAGNIFVANPKYEGTNRIQLGYSNPANANAWTVNAWSVGANANGGNLVGCYLNQFTSNAYIFLKDTYSGQVLNKVNIAANLPGNLAFANTTILGNSTTFTPVGVTQDDYTLVERGSNNTFRVYSKAGNGFTLTQTANSLSTTSLAVSGNNIVGSKAVFSSTPFVGFEHRYLIWRRDSANANSYIFDSEINTQISTTQIYAGTELLSNANTIISIWAQKNTGQTFMRRFDRAGNSNVWNYVTQQNLGVSQLYDTNALRFTIPAANTNILYTIVRPTTNIVNSASEFALEGNTYTFKNIRSFPFSLAWPPTFLSTPNSIILTPDPVTYDERYLLSTSNPVRTNRIIIDTNIYTGTLSALSFGNVTPQYAANTATTLSLSLRQPYTANTRNLWRYTSNLGVTTYQLPFDYSDSKLNRYMANLAVPGYVYQTQTANTFQLTRSSNGVVNLNELVNANITLSDGISNSTANVLRTSYYLGEIIPEDNPPQLAIFIDSANYTGNLNYSANLATLSNFESILTIPGYTVSTISAGNISVRSNSYGNVGNITANILQDYTQNLFPPNVTRTSFNNGNTAEIPDTNSPTISIDFANAFGYSPDPFVVTLPWNSNANVIANTIRNQSLIGGNITGTGPNVNITATSPGIETEPVITFGGNGSSNLSANNIFYPGSGNVDYMVIANTTYPLPQNANPSQTIVHLLGNYYSDDYKLIRTGATTFGLLNIQSGNYIQPQVTTTSNTQAITNITFAPGSNAVFALQDQTIDLGQARALMSNIILLS
jgi:hypothetical protein